MYTLYDNFYSIDASGNPVTQSAASVTDSSGNPVTGNFSKLIEILYSFKFSIYFYEKMK